MFGRRKRAGAEPEDEFTESTVPGSDELDDPQGSGDTPAVEVAAVAGPTTGPYDVADLDPADATPRIDLGGLRVPMEVPAELRMDVTDGNVVSVTYVRGPSAMQISVFAAPRREGIWDEIRGEIAESLTSGGGRAEEAEGPFGTELRAHVPGQGKLAPARFVGVDGPRWFLRALMSGPAATDPAQAAALEDILRQVVVDRGKDAMAPRDGLPLRLPREAAEALAASGQPTLDRLRRGPEIAETR